MKTETQGQPPILHRHWFREMDTENPREFGVYADTVAEARKGMHEAEKFEFVRTDEIHYTHATIAVAIARALGDDWTAVPSSDEHAECNWTLNRADGLSLWMSAPAYSHRDKFEFSLSPPRHKGSYVEPYEFTEGQGWTRAPHPRIGVGASKTAEQMAKDIKRRLLAEAERVNGLVLAEIAKREAAADARMVSLKALCAALGKVPQQYNGEWRFNVSFEGGDATVNEGGSVSFKTYGVDREKAVKLAQAIKAILG